MERCIECKKLIWPWEKAYPNGVWHQACYDIWEDGYNVAVSFCDSENRYKGYMTAFEMYKERSINNNKKANG